MLQRLSRSHSFRTILHKTVIYHLNMFVQKQLVYINLYVNMFISDMNICIHLYEHTMHRQLVQTMRAKRFTDELTKAGQKE